MKKLFLFLLLIFTSFSIVACNKQEEEKEPTKEDKYTLKEIDVVYSDGSEKHNIRQYEKNAETPYLGIKDFYKLLLKKTASSELSDLTVTTTDDVNYEIKTPRGGSAKVNVKDDILISPDFAKFNNTNGFGDKYLSNVAYDGSPWVQVVSVTSIDMPQATYFDYGSYNIDIYGDKDDVYFPIPTLNDIFCGMNLLFAAYNNKSLYIVDTEKNEELSSVGPDYNEYLYKNELSQAYIDYSYNETCFFYDNIAGRPGRSALEVYYDLSKGLDKALDSDELGRTVKSLLHSKKLGENLAGREFLGYLMADGGHTVYTVNRSLSVYTNNGRVNPSWWTNEVYADLMTAFNAIKAKNYEALAYYQAENNKSFAEYTNIRTYRKNGLDKNSLTLNGSNAYSSKGDIAMISIDSFMDDFNNNEEWNKYYNGQRDTIPYSETMGGAVSAVFKGLERAHNDPNIKTVIIDIASNTGGSSDELGYLICLLTGHNTLYFRNKVTNQLIEATFRYDLNLDGKFDELDEEYDAVGDLDIYVITSTASFSCGGISPIYLHDYGIPVLGDNSGGGSCAIYYRTDGLGAFSCNSSSYMFLSPSRKASADFERHYVCDYFINHENNDYSLFYDLDYLNDLIKQIKK